MGLPLAALAVAVALAAPVAPPVPAAVGSVPSPTVSAAPNCGDGGQDTLTVSGAGAPSGYHVEVTFDGQPFGPSGAAVGPQADGTWSVTAIADGVADGGHVISTVFYFPFNGSSGPPDIPGPSTAYEVPCPTLTVAPATISWRPGPVTLKLSGTGFGYYSQVSFTMAGTALTGSADANAYGDFSTTVTLPALPGCGTHDVVAMSPPARTAAAPLTVTCPALTITPSTIPALSLPRPLTWTLTGFDPDAAVALRIADRPIGVVLTDSSGAVSTGIPADRLPCGPLRATARQVGPGAVPEASAPLLVTCGRPPGRLATLTVVPGIVASGTPTLATGNGFTPGRTVRLTWLLPDATVAPGVTTAVVGASGSFNVVCLVLMHSRLGPRELVAAETAGVDRRAASAPVLVVPGSLQPGRHGLVTRR